jgi:hypothetical protein
MSATATQELLRRELARRVEAATDPADRHPRTGPAPDLSQLAAAQADAPDVAAIVVLRHFDPPAFARSSLQFALSLAPETAESWLRAFTRTVFLTGNPQNLVHRFRFEQVAADYSTAWFGPAPSADATGLRRLLKAFSGAKQLPPPPSATIDVPGAGGVSSVDGAGGAGGRRTFELLMATAGLEMTDYLVHLNHILAEAALTRTLHPGDRLRLRHVPRLTDLTTPYSALRVHRDSQDPGRLRAYACLRPEPGSRVVVP